VSWLESHQTLRDHPKTRRLARLLGVSIPAAIGHLHCLWWWCIDYAPDGDLTEIDHDVIADAGAWEGDPEAFIDALVNATRERAGVGFLENDDGLKVHDWMQYAGLIIVKREADAARKRDGRRRPVQRTSGGHPADGARTDLPTDLPIKTLTSPTTADDAVTQSGKHADLLFDSFWAAYPRRVGKTAAHKRWRQLGQTDRKNAVRAAENIAAQVKITGRALQFVQHPATFIGPARPFEDWVGGTPAGYVTEAGGSSSGRQLCPVDEMDLTWDEQGQHCPLCGWRPE